MFYLCGTEQNFLGMVCDWITKDGLMTWSHKCIFCLTWTSFSWLSTFWRILADMQKTCNFARAQFLASENNTENVYICYFSQRTVQTQNYWLHFASCILQRGRGLLIQTRKDGSFLFDSHPKYTSVTIMNSLFGQKEIGWTPSAHTQTKICSRDHRTHYFLHVWAVDRA